jgi:glycosyltransferase involved in cell wall biosynthesis
MKVGFLSFIYDGNTGSSVFAQAFVNSLARKKAIDEISIVTLSNRKPSIEKIENKTFYRISCLSKPPINRYEFLIKILRLKEKLKDFDMIHAQHSFEGILANNCKKSYGIPFVFAREVVSKYLPNIYSRFFLFNIEKFLTKHLNYDILVSWSKYMVENYFLEWGINPEKIRVIPGGVDTKLFNPTIKYKDIRQIYGIDSDETLFLSVKILSMSNTLGLLEAVKSFHYFLKNSGVKARYLIVGGGRGRPYLEKLVNRLGLNNKVILADPVPYRELVNYYKSADATVHFFAYDPSISMSMLDSLACGVPIIATDVGETANVVDNSVGFLVPPNIREMSDAMKRFCENPDLKKKMSKNAWNLVKRRFDIDIIADAYVDLYKELIGR